MKICNCIESMMFVVAGVGMIAISVIGLCYTLDVSHLIKKAIAKIVVAVISHNAKRAARQ